MAKIRCPVCHQKVNLIVAGCGDTLTVYSSDGYLLQQGNLPVPKGWVQWTCPLCFYVIKEERERIYLYGLKT